MPAFLILLVAPVSSAMRAAKNRFESALICAKRGFLEVQIREFDEELGGSVPAVKRAGT